jgi:AraC-like DNA-binding protein
LLSYSLPIVINRAWLKSVIEGALVLLWDADVPDHAISAASLLSRVGVEPPQSELERLLVLGVVADIIAKRRTLDDVSRAARVSAYIHEQSRNPRLSRATVARALGLSDSWLAHNLKLETGRSFREHVIDCRLADALRLLTESASSVKEVAHTVGFPSDNALTSIVRKRLGMAPGEWRRAQGAGRG